MAKPKSGKKVDTFSFKVKVEQPLGYRTLTPVDPASGLSIDGAVLAAMNEIDAKRDEILAITVSRVPAEPAESVVDEIDRNEGRTPG